MTLLDLQTLPGLQQIQKSPHPNSHPLKNKCRALAVRTAFFLFILLFIIATILEEELQQQQQTTIISIIIPYLLYL